MYNIVSSIDKNMKVYASRNTLIACSVVCGVCIVVLLFALLFIGSKNNKYEHTIGNVIENGKYVDQGTQGNTNNTVIHYYTCKYTVGGTEYTWKYRTFIPSRYKVGKTINIAYDQTNPQKVLNRFAIECCVMGIVFLGIMMLFFVKALSVASE